MFDANTLAARYPSDDFEILAAFKKWCELVRTRAELYSRLDDDDPAYDADDDDRLYDTAAHLFEAILRMPVAGAAGFAVKMYLILHFDDDDAGTEALTRPGLAALCAEPIYADLTKFLPGIPPIEERDELDRRLRCPWSTACESASAMEVPKACIATGFEVRIPSRV